MLKLKVPEKLRIKIAFITITFDTKNSHPLQWMMLGVTSFILNALLWPYIAISAINAVFGTKIYCYDINVFVGTWLLLLTISHFASKE